MRYHSTRGQAPLLDFREATLAGLALDGGLYLPTAWPRFLPNEFEQLATASYAETAFTVLRPFVSDVLGDEELRALITDAYGDFGHAAVTPLVQLDDRNWLLELFHGPTLAFKDVALQLLGGLFGHFLGDGEHITIVGATSGDTGSAAIEAVAGRPGIAIFMLHPLGRVTDVQRRQMTTVNAPNVHNIAIEGSFDDCQALVKALFNDREFRAEQHLSAVNSINWARVLAQIVYYVHAGARLGAPHRRISFSVPTGNFGDVFAGYCAARIGLPVGKLVVATNVNDILARALNDGDYSLGPLTATATLDAGMRHKAAQWFRAVRVDETDMMQAMAFAHSECGQLIDPHTGIGLAAARRLGDELPGPVVTLATAHPAKFPEAVERATGVRPSLPRRVGHLFDREERFHRLPADLDALKAHIRDNA